MRLSELSGESFRPDPDITGLTADSREVAPGFLFAAISGGRADGAAFIPEAEERGAAAILARPGSTSKLPIVFDDAPRRRLSEMAARFFPRQPDVIAGVTGANGKTSTAHFAAQLWSKLGRKAGSLGTLGARAEGIVIGTGLTTPGPVKLHETLDAMARAGIDRLAMEVSSHALVQSRADAVRFSIAAFTNITQDHLDYHADMDAYFDAKARLFETLLPAGGTAIVNADGEGAERIVGIACARGLKIITTGAAGDDIKLLKAAPTPSGVDLKVAGFGAEYAVRLPLIGLFQAENALLAAGVVVASGEDPARVMPLLEKLAGAPGRMERVAEIAGAGVFIDYAHTPDAVATALRAIRPHAVGRVIAIIGAGGDRDRAKRPLMGRAAAENADIVIVADDNPRGEDPAAIRREVLEGCPGAVEIGDRGRAIAQGIAMLASGDVLLIAGKGHETGQDVGREILPFNDADAAKAAALKRSKELGR